MLLLLSLSPSLPSKKLDKTISFVWSIDLDPRSAPILLLLFVIHGGLNPKENK